MDAQDFAPFDRYLKQVTDDPVRVAILVANNFVEEMIESVIAEAVPKSECSDVPDMRFSDKLKVIRALDPSITQSAVWQLIHKLNKLRAAAAHKDYESLQGACFVNLETAFRSVFPDANLSDPTTLLHFVVALCCGTLIDLKNRFREQRLRGD
jgi:hypothetical protein